MATSAVRGPVPVPSTTVPLRITRSCISPSSPSRDPEAERACETAVVLLIFDGDCGFCTTTARWIERRLPDSVRVAPWQILDIASIGLSEQEVTSAAYWVDADGSTHRGHMAVGRSLIAAGGGWAFAGHLVVRPPLSWLARPVYGWVAANRHRFPGATEACRVDLTGPADAPGASKPG